MKRLVAVGVAGLLAVSMIGSTADAAKKRRRRSHTCRRKKVPIALPAPFPADMSGCYSGLHRRGAVRVGAASSTTASSATRFNIDKRTWKKPFKLAVGEGQGDVDLDIHFYTEFGTASRLQTRPTHLLRFAYESRKAGGEKGKVPQQT